VLEACRQLRQQIVAESDENQETARIDDITTDSGKGIKAYQLQAFLIYFLNFQDGHQRILVVEVAQNGHLIPRLLLPIPVEIGKYE
jgi:hypothetical protein